LGIEIWFVPRLKSDEIATEDCLALLNNAKGEGCRVEEWDT
jgi:hypothetical protein